MRKKCAKNQSWAKFQTPFRFISVFWLTALLKNEITVCFLLLSLPVHAGLLKRIYYYFETCICLAHFLSVECYQCSGTHFYIFIWCLFFFFFFKSARLIKTALETLFFIKNLFFAFLNPKLWSERKPCIPLSPTAHYGFETHLRDVDSNKVSKSLNFFRRENQFIPFGSHVQGN